MDKEKSRARREKKPFYDRFWWLPDALWVAVVIVQAAGICLKLWIILKGQGR